MFRVVDLGPDGELTLRENIENVAPPDDATLRWVDLRGEEKGLERLRTEFAFHPLAIEDCRVFDQRPKLEEYRDHLFLVTQSFALLDAGHPAGADASSVDTSSAGAEAAGASTAGAGHLRRNPPRHAPLVPIQTLDLTGYERAQQTRTPRERGLDARANERRARHVAPPFSEASVARNAPPGCQHPTHAGAETDRAPNDNAGQFAAPEAHPRRARQTIPPALRRAVLARDHRSRGARDSQRLHEIGREESRRGTASSLADAHRMAPLETARGRR